MRKALLTLSFLRIASCLSFKRMYLYLLSKLACFGTKLFYSYIITEPKLAFQFSIQLVIAKECSTRWKHPIITSTTVIVSETMHKININVGLISQQYIPIWKRSLINESVPMRGSPARPAQSISYFRFKCNARSHYLRDMIRYISIPKLLLFFFTST